MSTMKESIIAYIENNPKSHSVDICKACCGKSKTGWVSVSNNLSQLFRDGFIDRVQFGKNKKECAWAAYSAALKGISE